MNRRFKFSGLLCSLLMLAIMQCSSPASAQADTALPLDKIKLPPGFHVSLYARVPAARQMVLSPSGVLYVGTRTEAAPHFFGQPEGGGEVHAVVAGKEGQAPEVITIARGLQFPNGVEF